MNMCICVLNSISLADQQVIKPSTLYRTSTLQPSYLLDLLFRYFVLSGLYTRSASKLVTLDVLCRFTSKLCFGEVAN